MKLTKAMVRKAWASQPGLAADWMGSGAPHCAVQSVYAQGYGRLDIDLAWTLIGLNDSGFSLLDGVTPAERRDCMIAMLDAGAFDAWLE